MLIVSSCRTTDGISLGELKDIVEKSLDKEKGELVMTLAEQLRREGRIEGKREGKREGKLEGRLEGERSMILESIELSVSLRFGKTSLENFMAHFIKNPGNGYVEGDIQENPIGPG